MGMMRENPNAWALVGILTARLGGKVAISAEDYENSPFFELTRCEDSKGVGYKISTYPRGASWPNT